MEETNQYPHIKKGTRARLSGGSLIEVYELGDTISYCFRLEKPMQLGTFPYSHETIHEAMVQNAYDEVERTYSWANDRPDSQYYDSFQEEHKRALKRYFDLTGTKYEGRARKIYEDFEF